MGVTLQGSIHPSVSHQTAHWLLCRMAATPPCLCCTNTPQARASFISRAKVERGRPSALKGVTESQVSEGILGRLCYGH